MFYRLGLFVRLDRSRTQSPYPCNGVLRRRSFSHKVRRQHHARPSQTRSAMHGHAFALVHRARDDRYRSVDLLLSRRLHVFPGFVKDKKAGRIRPIASRSVFRER